GVSLQEASQRALDLGATPASVIEQLADADVGVPLVVMTYYNLVARMGHERFCEALRTAGIAGVILPDLPLDELRLGGFDVTARDHDVETVLLAAPTTTDARLVDICASSRGFVYGVSLLGVTGERASLADSARL